MCGMYNPYRTRKLAIQELRDAVVDATAGTECSLSRETYLRPLVLDDITSSKRRTEHRIGLRPLRRDAASLDTPKRMTLTPFSEGVMSRRRTRGLWSCLLLTEAVSVSGTSRGFREALPLLDNCHIAPSDPFYPTTLLLRR